MSEPLALRDGMLRTRLRGVEPSEEIRRIVERWMQAVSERDSESSLERVSDLPGALMIGTDPEERVPRFPGPRYLGTPTRRT